MDDQIKLSKHQYQRLVNENNVLRDVVYELATKEPYGRFFTEAIYLTRKTIARLGLSGSCQDQYKLPKDVQ
jgi:hypothetical protein